MTDDRNPMTDDRNPMTVRNNKHFPVVGSQLRVICRRWSVIDDGV